MTMDTAVAVIGVLYLAAFGGGRWWLRKRDLVKARPAWQVYLLYVLSAAALGASIALIEHLLFG